MKQFADEMKKSRAPATRPQLNSSAVSRRCRCHGPDGERDGQAQGHARPGDHQYGRPRACWHRRIRWRGVASGQWPISSRPGSLGHRDPDCLWRSQHRRRKRRASSPMLSAAPSWAPSITRSPHRPRRLRPLPQPPQRATRPWKTWFSCPPPRRRAISLKPQSRPPSSRSHPASRSFRPPWHPCPGSSPDVRTVLETPPRAVSFHVLLFLQTKSCLGRSHDPWPASYPQRYMHNDRYRSHC